MRGSGPAGTTTAGGFPTVGVGFNLARPGARAAIDAVGADVDRIKSGKDSLTESQVAALLDSDAAVAIEAARSLFPDFDSYESVSARGRLWASFTRDLSLLKSR